MTPLWCLILHELATGIVRTALRWCYRAHGLGSGRVPATGPVLLVANHESYLDPPLIGVCIRQRELDYIARAGLFENWFMALAMRPLNCIPISEDGNDPRAIREILRRLGEGRAVLIFPEGSRSHDGAMGEFKRGAALLVKRARCPVVPVAVDGCFDAWPRSAERPRIGGQRIACAFGRAIDSETLMERGAEGAMHELEQRVRALRRAVRWRLRRQSQGRLPAHGPGDTDAR